MQIKITTSGIVFCHSVLWDKLVNRLKIIASGYNVYFITLLKKINLPEKQQNKLCYNQLYSFIIEII